MTTRGRTATATGLAITMTAVATGVSSTGGLALLLSFAGVLAGACLIFIGVRIADNGQTAPAPVGCPGVLAAGVRCLRRNLALIGLLLASAAACATVTAADRGAAPVLCFGEFAVLLLGLFLLNVGVILRGAEEH